MLSQHAAQCVCHAAQLLLIPAGILVHGRVPGRKQERVAIPKGNLQRLGDADQCLAARNAAADLDEAQVALRDPGIERRLHLALVAGTPPLAQQRSEVIRLSPVLRLGHGVQLVHESKPSMGCSLLLALSRP